LQGEQSTKLEENGPRWGVVMTVCEPAALVQTNVMWHLVTGAAAVHVFVDDPTDPAIQALRTLERCHVQVCDGAYWAAQRPNKGRPPSQMRRQTINANVAQRTCGLDWLFHIDADEFIWQDGDLTAELTAHAEPQVELNLQVLERLFPETGQRGLFDGAFRATSDLDDATRIAAFGDQAGMMKRGQYSHGAGKSGVRVGAGLRLGVHNATIRDGDRWRRAPNAVSTTARLLHFDGLTPLHWLAKFLRYRLTDTDVQAAILQPHRQTQIDWMLQRCETRADGEAAHHTLFALTPDRRARLEQFDLLREVPFDPATVIGPNAPDLSPAAFDAGLLRRNPWLTELLPDA